jgi:hypothetical protein
MQRSSVSAKIMLGPTASDVIVTDPKNTGEECTFATAYRQLPLTVRYSAPTGKKTPMNAPKQLLNALTEFLVDPTSVSQPEGISFQAFVVDNNETCVLMAESGGPQWFFRPFPSPQQLPKPSASDSKTDRKDWSIHGPLTHKLKEVCEGIAVDSSIMQELPSFVVMENQTIGTVLCFQSDHLQNVATILQSWGQPPNAVVRDWRSQLKSVEGDLPNTAETFVTEDGRLVPLSSVVQRLSNGLSSEQKRVKLFDNESFASSPLWPWSMTRTETPRAGSSDSNEAWQFDLGSSQNTGVSRSSSELVSSSRRKPKKVDKKTQLIAAASLLAVLLISMLAYFFTSQNGEPPPKPIAKAKVTDAVVTKQDADTKSPTPSAPEPATESFELVTTPNPSDTIDDESQQNEKMVQSLLAELSPIGSTSIRLDQSSPSSIIRDVLKPNASDAGLAKLSIDDETERTNDAETESNSNVPASPELNVVTTERGVITLEKPLTLRSAYAKEIVSIGKPVLAKASRCEIELKLSDKVVVEPMEVTTIEGAGKSTWKIAIEDEPPEMWVKIESKPGTRWEVKAWVGLREEKDAMLYAVGPRDAPIVGSRLIDYKQRVGFTIESLRAKRSNSRGKSSSVLSAQIKQLEAQEKEVDKAIERWKVIDRLSHFFFDTNEVRIQFTAIEKDSAKDASK